MKTLPPRLPAAPRFSPEPAPSVAPVGDEATECRSRQFRILVEDGQVVYAEAHAARRSGPEHPVGGGAGRTRIQPSGGGICRLPIVHAICGSKIVEQLLGVPFHPNGRLLRNLVLGVLLIGEQLSRFYQLALLDFVRLPRPTTFSPSYLRDFRIPRRQNDELVLHSLQVPALRRLAHEAAGLFAGPLPRAARFVRGGLDVVPTPELVEAWRRRVEPILTFVDDVWERDLGTVLEYYPDYDGIGEGGNDYLSFGAFELDASDENHLFRRGLLRDGRVLDLDLPRITAHMERSWEADAGAGVPFLERRRQGSLAADDVFAYLSTARSGAAALEVGPFARMKVAGRMKGAGSVLSRHVARVVEAREIGRALREWAGQLELGVSAVVEPPALPEAKVCYGLVEAPGGPRGHWMRVEGGRITRWQAYPARGGATPHLEDEEEARPFEVSLVGTPIADRSRPIEALRVIHSFDPCARVGIRVMRSDEEPAELEY